MNDPDDISIGPSEPDPETDRITHEFIENYKKRPQYAQECEEANRILRSLGIIVPPKQEEKKP